MKARTTLLDVTDTPPEASRPPAPLFANLLEPPGIADDLAGAMYLVLATAPVALFLFFAAISPFAPACTDVVASAAVAAGF
jgi:hypothetical protein